METETMVNKEELIQELLKDVPEDKKDMLRYDLSPSSSPS